MVKKYKLDYKLEQEELNTEIDKVLKEMNAIMAIKEVYEARIADIKASSAEHMASLKKDKRFLWVAVCVFGGFLILFLLMDLYQENLLKY